MSTVRRILEKKGRTVHSTDATQSVMAAAQLMNKRTIGGLAVIDDGNMVGILTERDILTRVVAAARDPAATTVREVMTSPVATCRPETSVHECIAVMTGKHIRHLPVVDDQGLCGMITSRDLLAFQVTEHEATIRHLKSYASDVGGEGG